MRRCHDPESIWIGLKCCSDMRMAEFKAFGNVASPMRDRERFYEVFRDDFSKMDLIYCSLPITACAYFMPFGVPLVVRAVVKFGTEFWNPEQVSDMISNLRLLASHPAHTICASSAFMALDHEYWVGGARPVVIPYLGMYFSGWKPRAEVGERRKLVYLASHFRQLNQELHLAYSSYSSVGLVRPLEFKTSIGSNFSDFLSIMPTLEGCVLIPYYPETMQFWELYTAAVPIYVPSLELLFEWRSARLNVVYQHNNRRAPIGQAANVDSDMFPYAPSDVSPEALRWWMQHSDLITTPHVQHYGSWADLFSQLQREGQRRAVSAQMARHNEHRKREVLGVWSSIVLRALDQKSHARSEAEVAGPRETRGGRLDGSRRPGSPSEFSPLGLHSIDHSLSREGMIAAADSEFLVCPDHECAEVDIQCRVADWDDGPIHDEGWHDHWLVQRFNDAVTRQSLNESLAYARKSRDTRFIICRLELEKGKGPSDADVRDLRYPDEVCVFFPAFSGCIPLPSSSTNGTVFGRLVMFVPSATNEAASPCLLFEAQSNDWSLHVSLRKKKSSGFVEFFALNYQIRLQFPQGLCLPRNAWIQHTFTEGHASGYHLDGFLAPMNGTKLSDPPI